MSLELCWREGARPVEGSSRADRMGEPTWSGSRGGTGPTPCLRPSPDKPILSSAPECVGPHGRRGDAFHPVCVVSKHVDRLLYCQVVDMHLGVSCPCDQDAVPSVRQELLGRDWRRGWQVVGLGHRRRPAWMLAPFFPSPHQIRKRAHPRQSAKKTLDLEHQPVGPKVKIRMYTFISPERSWPRPSWTT